MNQKHLPIAYHEAGHVAACLYFQIPLIKIVSIIENEDSLGRMSHEIKSELFKRIEYDISPDAERYFKEIMIMAFAGPCAEARFRNQTTWTDCGYYSDYRQAVEIAERFFSDNTVLEKYLEYITAEADNLIKFDFLWPFIEKLAYVLLEKKEIEASECIAIYQQHLEESLIIHSP